MVAREFRTGGSVPHVVLVAEDDPDDRLLLRDAFDQADIELDIRVVDNGTELLDYLQRRGPYTAENAPRPSIVLLDLNLPQIDGREALRAIKRDLALRTIPIVILTTSRSAEDILTTYDRGAAAYIPKPSSYQGLVNIVRTLCEFWFRTSLLPTEGNAPAASGPLM
jgi:CheY-like chemotaxis protein